MTHFTVYKKAGDVDSTVISNLFIDEYMTGANDAQIKVYLYLLRMMSACKATSVSDIADKFNHTEKEVLRALKYWEKQQLLSLDYDTEKNLVGINILDLTIQGRGKERTAGIIPTLVSTTGANLQNVSDKQPIVQIQAPAVESEAIGTEEPEEDPFAKPTYSAAQLKNFKDQENTAQLFFIAESYIGKPLTPSEMKTLLYFTDVLNFSDDLIDYLIQYCVERGKKDFRYIEKVAVSWATAGITTPKQAQKQAAKYDQNVYSIMNGLGKNSSPTSKEMEYISRWTKEYGFTTDVILEACGRTVLATDKQRFAYAEKILSNWHEQKVHHKSDIEKIDDLYKQHKKTPAASTGAKVTNRFNQFTQNTYDFHLLEEELRSN